MSKLTQTFKTEDWLSLFTGFLIIALAISGIVFAPLKFKLTSIDTNTFSLVGIYFILALFVSFALVWLHNPSLKNHFLIFIAVFILAILSIFLSSIDGVKN